MRYRILFTLSAFIVTCIIGGCGREPSQHQTPPPSSPVSRSKPSHLVADPVLAVKTALPSGWVVLRIEENTYPSYRPKASGKGIYLGQSRQSYSKMPYDAAIYIMPPDYEDGGVDPTNGNAMTWPARLVASTVEAKIYLWQGVPTLEFEEKMVDALTD